MYSFFSSLKLHNENDKDKDKDNHLVPVHIIFILPNIYDHISGVSNKYTSFIQFLHQHTSIKITLFHISQSDPCLPNIRILPTSSLPLPLYPGIRVPICSYSHLKNALDRKMRNKIIFHTEFIWLHSNLLRLKTECENVELIPNIHTNIDYYIKEYLSKIPGLVANFELAKYVDTHLIEKRFDRIILTGEILHKKYVRLLGDGGGGSGSGRSGGGGRVINVNEIDYISFLPGYKSLAMRRDHIWKNGAFVNIICCCRLSVEKSIESVFDLSSYIVHIYLGGDSSKVRLHIIGDGPHRAKLEEYAKRGRGHGSGHGSGHVNVIFHGSKPHSWIVDFYKHIYNPIFLFCSTSETFGKTAMEALCCGIPVFHRRCDVANAIFEDRKNAFLFDGRREWIDAFDSYMKMKYEELVKMNDEMKCLAKKYDQRTIFEKWKEFLLHH